MTNRTTSDCPGCGAPDGYPPAGPCIAHGTEYAVANIGQEICDVMRGDGSIPQPTCILPVGHRGPHYG
jgi:hypothetical protein